MALRPAPRAALLACALVLAAASAAAAGLAAADLDAALPNAAAASADGAGAAAPKIVLSPEALAALKAAGAKASLPLPHARAAAADDASDLPEFDVPEGDEPVLNIPLEMLNGEVDDSSDAPEITEGASGAPVGAFGGKVVDGKLDPTAKITDAAPAPRPADLGAAARESLEAARAGVRSPMVPLAGLGWLAGGMYHGATPQVETIETVVDAPAAPEGAEDKKYFLGWLDAAGAWVDPREVDDEAEDGAPPAALPHFYATFSPTQGVEVWEHSPANWPPAFNYHPGSVLTEEQEMALHDAAAANAATALAADQAAAAAPGA